MDEYRVVSCVLVFVVACIGTFLIRSFASKLNFVDRPNDRSSHSVPTPRGGGVAIVLVFLTAICVLGAIGLLDATVLSVLAVGGGAVAVVGLLDDRSALPARTRFIVHSTASVFAVFKLGSIPFISSGLLGVGLSYFVSAVAIAWAINLFNFMDGIDGIAASEAIFIAGVGAWFNIVNLGEPGLSAAFLYLAAATLGFLVWNWPRARIFLGDAGSGFLGFALAAIAMAASRSAAIPIQVWLILSGVFLVDATVTLLRRVLRGDRWFEAHRLHAYQHLARRWQSHLYVTLLVSAINIFWLLPWALYAMRTPMRATEISAVALVPLALLALIAGAGKQDQYAMSA
jgi:Fuc2NAc and GlcNAc transferase